MPVTPALAAPRAAVVLFLSAALSAQAPCPDPTTVDDFEGGLNRAGWSFGVTVPDRIEEVGGNPGAWLRNSGIVSFAPILTSDPSRPGPWSGDFRANGVQRIAFDARTDARGFGQPRGFTMTLLLRDTKGTPDASDDDYAYAAAGEVPQIGAGWQRYDIAVPSDSTAAVPPGWQGGWAGGLGFRPGVDWNDLIRNVDRVEMWWIDPTFFAIITNWDVGVDNITFEQTGGARTTVRNGSGVNPQILTVRTPPSLGGRWTLDLDCSVAGSGVGVLMGSGPSAPLATPFGEFLIDPVAAVLLDSGGTVAGLVRFHVSVPALPALCGARLSVQAGCGTATTVVLTNAIDAVAGS